MQRRGMKQGAAVIAILISMSMIAAGCGKKKSSSSGSGDAVNGGTLVDYYTFAAGEPAHIDPGLATELSGAQAAAELYDGLYTTSFEDGKTEPWIAKSDKVSDDGLTHTFTLHDGVKFSNGDPVLPSSFAYGWNRVVSPAFASELSYHMLPIKGAQEVIDGKATTMSGVTADDAKMTLTVELAQPNSSFVTALSHQVFSPVDEKVMKSVKDQSTYEQGVMIGNGPFKQVKPWEHNVQIQVERNPNYWGGPDGDAKPHLDGINFKISKDIETAYSTFLAGQGETAAVPPAKYTEVKTKFPDTSALGPTLGIYYMGFNQSNAVVGGDANLKLRQAIALVIDKGQINDDVYNGSRVPASAIVPPEMPGALAQKNVSTIAGQTTPNLSKAQQLLKQWENDTGKKASSLEISLNFNAGGGHEPVINDIAADMKQLGIKTKQVPGNADTYFSDMREGNGQFLRAGWIADYVDYANMLCPILCSVNAGTGDNLVLYKNTKFDDLMNSGSKETDQSKAAAYYRDAEKLALDDAVMVPIVWYSNNVVWDNTLGGVKVNPLQFVNYEQMWLKSGGSATTTTAK